MNYDIEILNGHDNYKIINLAEKVNLDEKIDFKCKFIGVKKNNELVGFIGINMQGHYPRFEHIVIDHKYQRTRVVILLARAMEKFLKPYKCYVSYILHINNTMKKYAEKWGMRPYAKDNKGQWYHKNIGEEKCAYY